MEQLRAEAHRAGRHDAKLKESLKTIGALYHTEFHKECRRLPSVCIERLQKEAAEIEEERLKLEAVVDPLMKANRAFQNEQAAQAALIEDLRKELALAKQQLADKDVALLRYAAQLKETDEWRCWNCYICN